MLVTSHSKFPAIHTQKPNAQGKNQSPKQEIVDIVYHLTLILP